MGILLRGSIILMLFTGCKGVDAVVPQKVGRATIAVLVNGQNWPKLQNNKQRLVAHVTLYHYGTSRTELGVTIRRVFGVDSINLESLVLTKIPRKVGKINLVSFKEWTSQPNASSATYTIRYDDVIDAAYFPAVDYPNLVNVSAYDESSGDFKALIDLKLAFLGDDERWKKAKAKNKDVKERSLYFKGEISSDKIDHVYLK